jgi:hypothetical protein
MTMPSMSAREDLTRWASALGGAYDDIALVVQFDVPDAAPAGAAHVCLVMKDGSMVPWFAEGKGIEGLTYAAIPGRAVKERILADERCRWPGLRLYMNFCDVRALIYEYSDGRERLAGEELVGAPYRILYPERAAVPSLDEFFHLWGGAGGRGEAPGGGGGRGSPHGGRGA